MGNGIASNFLKNGYTVYVWNRNRIKLKDLENRGAIVKKSPKEVAQNSDMVFEVTANDKSSKSVWTGKNGILSGSTKDKVLITNATLSIPWTEELVKLTSNYKFLDMPMTGGRVGAENGKLVLLVGGDQKILNSISKDLEAISEKVIHFGKAGSGMKYKLLLNMMQGIHINALGEALRLSKEIGLDTKQVGDALSERPGGVITNLAWSGYQNEPKPINFSVEWITKDLKYAKKAAKKSKTPLLDQTLKKYSNALKKKLGDKDWTYINQIPS